MVNQVNATQVTAAVVHAGVATPKVSHVAAQVLRDGLNIPRASHVALEVLWWPFVSYNIEVGCQIIQVAGAAVSGGYTATLLTPGPLQTSLPNDPSTALPYPQGSYTPYVPTTVVTGLTHLIGKTVTGIADGLVISPRVVDQTGAVTLDQAASKVIVGLGYTSQLQTMRITTGDNPVTEGKRKQITGVTVRTDCTLGLTAGPDFTSMTPIPGLLDTSPYTPPGTLVSDDCRVIIQTDWSTEGQVCIEQDYPLPATVLAIIKEVTFGDDQS